MGLFSFFNKKNREVNGLGDSLFANTPPLPEIPENIFVENTKPAEAVTAATERTAIQTDVGINALFQFLERNHEAKGYEDALINSDTSHMEQNIEALRNDLARTVRKVKTFYEDFIREINFHIASRSRSGMIDTVEELNVKKEIAEDHIRQVEEIEEQAKIYKGLGQGIILSYTRGFKNGLAAISHHSILKRNF
ncbi:hypothetical protein AAE02nite_42230 [Adhaeribacter aerolatus]|uniref:Uncharacterized protein n=1 Tax=Adhaeribacter aerolatus TaxID=670289 RepID=A0A512B3M0_9BACT|nr:hypothetical protein [Adhaeribacter aerolatus]GEO06559.1 hypothetical protein AAE02nite_42230 [Adhaeribacter aerolatus]